MRKLILAAAMTAVAMPIAVAPTAADAQSGYNTRREMRECRRELRHSQTRREYLRERRECEREIARARRDDWRSWNRYDYNRPPAGGYYYADDYYRDGRYYRERTLSYNDRIYRGRDGRYYCRRDDGTTGLIVGGVAGGILGNIIAPGGSEVLGTILGAAAGAAVGREVDRGDVRCR